MENIKIKTIDLRSITIDSETVIKIPEELAVKNCLIAFKDTKDTLSIAVSCELEFGTKEVLRFLCGKNLEFYIADKEQILEAINMYYCKGDVKNAIYTLNKKIKLTKDENLKQTEKESLAVKITKSIINGAIHKRASDIHIEPFATKVLVRFRIDGVMYEFMNIPKELYSFICTRLKVKAYMNIAEKRMPQDGKISYVYKEKEYDFRISTLPTINGEKIVIRILYKSETMKKLDLLGYSIQDINIVKRMIKSNHGLLLVTGPTGSGKSTTLYSILNELSKEKKNIISIEDPVEYTIEGVNQVNVNGKIGLNFAGGLKSILRQDPDIIMVGEIRDEETAHIAVRAAITGHLVISTLHTNNARESILRLKDMGIQSYLIESCLIGVISQRLVRKICDDCKKPIEKYNANKLGFSKEIYKGNGCFKCNNTGYYGRTVVYEIISKVDSTKDSENLKDNCKKLVERGVTTYDEFLRINL